MASRKKPFHVVQRRFHGTHQTYEIWVNNRPFLTMVQTSDPVPLKRHDAYAIVRLLNNSTSAKKWADKFSDPY
jgi:hypothetical protein